MQNKDRIPAETGQQMTRPPRGVPHSRPEPPAGGGETRTRPPFPEQSFAAFKTGALRNGKYRLEAGKRRNAACGGPSVLLLYSFGFLLYAYLSSYFLYHVLGYQKLLEGPAGFLLTGLGAVFLYLTLLKFRKRSRFNMNQAIWASVCAAYDRTAADEMLRAAAELEKRQLQLYWLPSDLCRVLATGGRVDDGYKCAFLCGGNLVLLDPSAAAEGGLEITEIPLEAMTDFRVSEIKLAVYGAKVRGRLYRRNGWRYTVRETVGILEYRAKDAVSTITFYNLKGTEGLTDLLPERVLHRSWLRRRLGRYLDI